VLAAPVVPITTEALKVAWSSIKSLYTAAFTAWTASGQGESTNFWRFCGGNSVLLYFFLSLGGVEPDTNHLIALRVMEEDAQGEMGSNEITKKKQGTPTPTGSKAGVLKMFGDILGRLVPESLSPKAKKARSAVTSADEASSAYFGAGKLKCEVDVLMATTRTSRRTRTTRIKTFGQTSTTISLHC
jgi:hypothetical protein